jgi:hypothetical protein
VLDVISQITQKQGPRSWVTDVCLAGMLKALQESLDLQATLCGQGYEHGPIEYKGPHAAVQVEMGETLAQFHERCA